MKKLLPLVLLLCSYAAFARPPDAGDRIVDRISQILIGNYDRRTQDNLIDFLIVKFGKSTYIDMIELWKRNYRDIEHTAIEVHPTAEKIAKIIEERVDQTTADEFRALSKQLVRLSLENLQLYYRAVSEQQNPIEPEAIDSPYINACMMNRFYYLRLKDLFDEELDAKAEMHRIMEDPRLQNRLWFHLKVFGLVEDMRKKVIRQTLARYEHKTDTVADWEN